MAAGSYTLFRDDRSDLWPQRLFGDIADHLRSHGVDVRCEGRPTFRTRTWGRRTREAALGDSFAVLQDDRSGDYVVLDCHDWTVPFEMARYMRDSRCRLILKCQYRAPAPGRLRRLKVGPLRDIQGIRCAIVRPWTYFDLHWPSEQDRHIALRTTERTDPRMFFRGGLTGFDPIAIAPLLGQRDMKNMRQPVIEALLRRGIMNDDPSWIPYEPYIEQMATHRIGLSLPGDGEFCHRDMEAFAIGVSLLRPRLRNGCHDLLRENHHYISVDVDPETASPAQVAERIAECYSSVIDRPEYLASIARNGAEWYDRNVRVPSVLDLTVRLLGIELAPQAATRLQTAS
jgi:hypothetical protein